MTHSPRPVRVRVAPSPTGAVHIGTISSALYNKLFARHMGGQFLVRIEDTDKERSTAENVAKIKDALTWAQLTPDEGYVVQSENTAAHQSALTKLVEAGFAAKDAEGVTRFVIPADETVTWQDLVQGDVSVETKAIEPFALARSDGSVTYHLAVCVDDAGMNISHVLRGADHISNTPKHILLHRALAAVGMAEAVPTFGHLPLLTNSEGRKLSKRRDVVDVQAFKEAGYLPQALCNYLARIGFAHGEEVITEEDLANIFDISKVSRSNAVWDEDKLKWFNLQYVQQLSSETLIPMLQPYYTEMGLELTDETRAYVERGLDDLKGRPTLKEIAEASAFLLQPFPLEVDADMQKIVIEGKNVLSVFIETAQKETEWTQESLAALVKSFLKENGLKFPQLGKPIRVILAGQVHGMGLSELLFAYGKDEALRRLGVFA